MAYCNACESNPCSCRKPLGASVGASWIHQQCASPGCTTTIRVRAGLQTAEPICRWCLAPKEEPASDLGWAERILPVVVGLLLIGTSELWAQSSTVYSDGSRSTTLTPGVTHYAGPHGETGLSTELTPGSTWSTLSDANGETRSILGTNLSPGRAQTEQNWPWLNDRGATRGEGGGREESGPLKSILQERGGSAR